MRLRERLRDAQILNKVLAVDLLLTAYVGWLVASLKDPTILGFGLNIIVVVGAINLVFVSSVFIVVTMIQGVEPKPKYRKDEKVVTK